MADDTTPAAAAEPTTPAANSPTAEKVKRAPRKPRAAKQAAAAPAETKSATPGRGRKKSADTPADALSATPAVRGRRGKPSSEAAKPGRQRPTTASAAVISSASDEMVELLQLEEENKRLRQQLSEKLRAENTDLRKKLGVK